MRAYLPVEAYSDEGLLVLRQFCERRAAVGIPAEREDAAEEVSVIEAAMVFRGIPLSSAPARRRWRLWPFR